MLARLHFVNRDALLFFLCACCALLKRVSYCYVCCFLPSYLNITINLFTKKTRSEIEAKILPLTQ